MLRTPNGPARCALPVALRAGLIVGKVRRGMSLGLFRLAAVLLFLATSSARAELTLVSETFQLSFSFSGIVTSYVPYSGGGYPIFSATYAATEIVDLLDSTS
jgi:hypothetical protein